MARPEDVPNLGLADYLDSLLRGGNFGDLVNSAPKEPAIISPDEELREKLNGYIEGFIGMISPNALKALDRRFVANAVRNNFATWKTGLTRQLTDQSAAESEIKALDGLTLKDVAIYAKEQFDRFKTEAATFPLGTPKQKEARAKSDYWSIMEEIITPASDPDLDYN